MNSPFAAKSSLSDACDLITDGTHFSPASFDTGEFMYVTSKNVREGRLDLTDITYVSRDVHNSIFSGCPVRLGDVLYVKDGANTGLAAINTVKQPFSMLSSVALIRPKEMALDAKYLMHWLNSPHGRAQMLQNMSGAAIKRLVLAQIRRTSISLPPVSKQRQIAAILDQADDLRRLRREAIKRLNRLKRSMLDQLMEQAGVAATATYLSELVDEFRYGTSEKATGEGHPVLRIPNVIGDMITVDDLKYVTLGAGELERLRLREGDLVFVRTNGNPAYVGRSAVVKASLGSELGFSSEDFVYASYLIRARLKPNLADPSYLQTYLGGPVGRKVLLERAKTSAGQFNINIEGLGAIPVKLPPIGLQRRFADQARSVDLSLSTQNMHLAKLDALFASLQHRAFGGEL